MYSAEIVESVKKRSVGFICSLLHESLICCLWCNSTADYLDSYHSIDASISSLLLNPELSTTTVAAPSATDSESHKDDDDDNAEDDYDGGEEDYDTETIEGKDKEEATVEDVTRKPEEEDYEDEDDDDDVDEDEGAEEGEDKRAEDEGVLRMVRTKGLRTVGTKGWGWCGEDGEDEGAENGG